MYIGDAVVTLNVIFLSGEIVQYIFHFYSAMTSYVKVCLLVCIDYNEVGTRYFVSIRS